jgi:hypothetical protein
LKNQPISAIGDCLINMIAILRLKPEDAPYRDDEVSKYSGIFTVHSLAPSANNQRNMET